MNNLAFQVGVVAGALGLAVLLLLWQAACGVVRHLRGDRDEKYYTTYAPDLPVYKKPIHRTIVYSTNFEKGELHDDYSEGC